MNKKTILTAIINILLIFVLSIILVLYIRRTVNDTRNFSNEVKEAGSLLYTMFPIYQDYATPQKESQLRTYLLSYHLRAAANLKAQRVKNNEEINKLIKSGELTSASGKDWYFYNVPGKLRYLTPLTVKGLYKISEIFNRTLREKGHIPRVKFAVSSALRPVNYQDNLKKINHNASDESSHSYGISFDIFYESYQLVFTAYKSETRLARSILSSLRYRMGYLTGMAYARQLQAALHETLIGMQNQKLLYAIQEKSQKCYHVTILRSDK